MQLAISWLVFPLVLGVLSLGCGLLVEYLSGLRLTGALVLPVGLATMIVAAQLATLSSSTARSTVPIVVTLAVAGLALTLPWTDRRPGAWAPAAAVSVFAAYAAPVVLSGRATFLGYIKLDDTATFLAFTDRLLEHGRSLAGLAPSTYEAALSVNLTHGYPVGTFLPLGIGAKLVGSDPAWVYQPCIAFYAAMLALALYAMLDRVVVSRGLRAFSAFVAAQAALLYAYSLWGGIKELVAAALIALLAALSPLTRESISPARRVLPIAVCSAATVGVLSVSGGLWIAPLLAPIAVVAVRRLDRRAAAGLGVFAAATVVFSIPSLLVAGNFLNSLAPSLIATGGQLGNLIKPLSLLQLFGVWPVSDFRFDPRQMDATHVLIAVVAGAAIVGLLFAWKRRAWNVLLYLGTVVLGSLVLERSTSPWLAAKAYATASPALVLTGMVGGVALFESGRRVEGAFIAAAIAGGVLWSNVLGYHDVWLAPRNQLSELEYVGNRFAGDGPTLMTEYQVNGVRHFLRKMDPEGASELRRRQVPLRDGRILGKAEFADIDQFRYPDLLLYRTLVLRSSPVLSRPAAPYRLVWRGRFYEVWQRDEPVQPQVLAHLPLGDAVHAAGVPACSDVLALAKLAASNGGLLEAVPRASAADIPLSSTSYPPRWVADPTNPSTLTPYGDGSLTTTVSVSQAGPYEVWLGGSFRRDVEITVDGARVGSDRNELSNTGQWVPFGTLSLTAGQHAITLTYNGSTLLPGSGGQPFAIGPLAFSPTDSADRIESIQPSDAKVLCGQSLDWVEAVKP